MRRSENVNTQFLYSYDNPFILMEKVSPGPSVLGSVHGSSCTSDSFAQMLGRSSSDMSVGSGAQATNTVEGLWRFAQEKVSPEASWVANPEKD